MTLEQEAIHAFMNGVTADELKIGIDSPARVWTDAELIAQFRRCEQWQDAEQWGILGDLYRQAGELRYQMNWKYCYRKWHELLQADECRANSRPDGQKG